MTPETLQTISNVLILTGALLAGAGVWGQFYFGLEANKARSAQITSSIVLFMGAVIGALGAFGHYYYGQVIAHQEQIQKDHPEIKLLSMVQLGAEQAFTESKLGLPYERRKLATGEAANYLFNWYWLRVFYSGKPSKLVGYFVISRNENFLPELPWSAREGGLTDSRLGKVTFDDIGSETLNSPTADCCGQIVGFWYIETSSRPYGSANFTTLLAGYFSEIGAAYPDSVDMTDVAAPWPEHPTSAQRSALKKAREQTIPNAFGVFAEGHEPDDVFDLVFTTTGGFFN